MIPFVIDSIGTSLLILHGIGPNQHHLFSILTHPFWRKLGLVSQVARVVNRPVVGVVELMPRAIGIFGSRDASEQAQAYALGFAREAAEQDYVVISGYARGVDQQAHRGALEAGGTTIAVLPQGINSISFVPELGPLIDPEHNFLALSMFEPDAPWKVWRAMQRNKLLVGLSSAVLVVEPRETGGTINAVMECGRQDKPLWAISGWDAKLAEPTILKLKKASAIPLTNSEDLRTALGLAASKREERVEQLALDLS